MQNGCLKRTYEQLRKEEKLKVKEKRKRWQEYTKELYKKDLHDPYNHDGEIAYLKSDILESEV